MKPKIVKNCSKSYRIDHQKIVGGILDHIPPEYLAGLNEITFVCKAHSPRMKYIAGKNSGGSASIEINLDYDDYNKYPLISVFSLNIDFLLKINEHIDTYVKPTSQRPDILARKRSTVEYRWMYLGVWSPLLYLFHILVYPIRKAQSVRATIFQLMSRLAMVSKSHRDK